MVFIDLIVNVSRLLWIVASLLAFPAWVVSVAFDLALAAWERGRKAAPSAEVRARRMRFRSYFWPSWMLIAGLGFGFALNHPANARGGPGAADPLWPLLVAFSILAVVLHLVYRGLARSGSRRPQVAAAVTAPPWMRAVLFLVFLAMLFASPPWQARGGVPPTTGEVVARVVASFVAWMALYIAALVAYAFATRYDRASAQAHKRAKEGDLDGAILDLQGDVGAREPTANRLNGLGLLLLRREDWAAAHDLFRRAHDLAPRRADFRNNLAIAMIEMGRPAEAEPILSDLVGAYPRDPIMVLNHARSLIALGRLDEAEARLGQVEALMSRGGPYRNKTIREDIRKAIAKNHGRLATARGAADREAATSEAR